MSKRFIDTSIWGKEWFMQLEPKYKCLYIYLFTQCDNIGIWDVNKTLAETMIRETIDWDNLPPKIKEDIQKLSPTKWYLKDYLDFQYGHLTESCPAHKPIIFKLDKIGIKYPINRVSNTLQEKEKEKEKEMNKEKDKDIALFDFESFWKTYPARGGVKQGKQKAKQLFHKNIKTQEDYNNLSKALKNYSRSKTVSDGFAMDASRFLNNELWKDWVDVEIINSRITRSGEKILTKEEERNLLSGKKMPNMENDYE